ncbi:MAG: RES family NAD+ phosphorylase [bacterium]
MIWNFDDLDEKLKRQNRYFNKPIQDALDKIFSNLQLVKTKTGQSVLEIAGPEQPISGLYRARVFQSDKALVEALEKPDLKLGPPPYNLARGGRMNAHVISVFYGATSIETAIAETRPPVGSKVLVGNFPITTKLILLNLSKFSEIKSVGIIFDPHFIEEKDRIAFMRHLEERLTKPVMPDDETIDYVTTQAVADYLSQIEHPHLDGIIFKSVQGADAGLNVVLFNKSSKVKRNPVFENSVVEVSTYIDSEDGPETWYSINIDATPMKGKNPDDKKDESKLNLDINSLTIHHIKKVSYSKDSFSAYYYLKNSGNTEDWKF